MEALPLEPAWDGRGRPPDSLNFVPQAQPLTSGVRHLNLLYDVS